MLYNFLIVVSKPQKKKEVDLNQEFDIVILNGKVIDPETNFDIAQNGGIKHRKINIISKNEITGKINIADMGTYEKPNHPAVRVSAVLVNGVAIVDKGELITETTLGQPIIRIIA